MSLLIYALIMEKCMVALLNRMTMQYKILFLDYIHILCLILGFFFLVIFINAMHLGFLSFSAKQTKG